MLRVGVLPRATWALARTSLKLLTWTSSAQRASSSGLASAAGATPSPLLAASLPGRSLRPNVWPSQPTAG